MEKTVTGVLSSIATARQPMIDKPNGPWPDGTAAALASAGLDLADVLGDPIEASSWLLDGFKSLWVLSGVDEAGEAYYDAVNEQMLLVEEDGTPTERETVPGIEDAYGIAEVGPTVLLRTRPS